MLKMLRGRQFFMSYAIVLARQLYFLHNTKGLFWRAPRVSCSNAVSNASLKHLDKDYPSSRRADRFTVTWPYMVNLLLRDDQRAGGSAAISFDSGWNMHLQRILWDRNATKKSNAQNNFFPLHLFTSYPPSQYSLRAWRSMLRQSERTTSVKPRGSGLQHMVWLRTSEEFHQ